MSDKTIKTIAELREQMADMTDDERLDVAAKIISGYCSQCGGVDPFMQCQCWNDE